MLATVDYCSAIVATMAMLRPNSPVHRQLCSILGSPYRDWGDEAVAASGDVDDEAIPILTVTQRAAQRRHMNSEVGGLNENVGPNASHQVLLADQLSVAFKQSNQDVQSATSERHRLVAFQQKQLRSEQAKRSERKFCWRCAGRFGSFLEQWPDRVRTLNSTSDVRLRFEMKLLQASESCSRPHNDLACFCRASPHKHASDP